MHRAIPESQAVLDTFFEAAPIGMAYLDRNLVFQKVNKVLAKMNGIPVKAHLDRRIDEALPGFPPELLEQIRQVVVTGKPILNLEVSGNVKGRNGKIRHFIASYFAVKNKKEEIVGLGVLIQDRTKTRKIEDDLEIAKDNLTYLAQASKVLSSSMDYKTTLKEVAESAVPDVADWVTVHLVNDDGKIELLTAAHSDTQKAQWVKDLDTQFPPESTPHSAIKEVITTGKPVFLPELTAEILTRNNINGEHLALLQKIGFASLIIVPIKKQKKSVGALTLITAESRRCYTRADYTMAQELAIRASLAIENSILYQSINQERQRLVNLVENVPGVVWEAWGQPDNDHQRIDFVNGYVEKMLGYSVNEWFSTTNFGLKIVHPEDRERAAEESRVIFESREWGVSRFRWKKKDGSYLWVEAQSTVILDKAGNPLGMRGVTMDISERVEEEKRKDAFISMASHELKTPITSQRVYVQLLQQLVDKNKDTHYDKYLSKIVAQTDKITNLISDLLDVSTIQAGKMKFHFSHFDLQDLVNEVVADMREVAFEYNFSISGSVQTKAFGDEERIAQVINNLLTNAVKYSPNSLTINIFLSENESCLRVGVQDFGIGIEPAQKMKIFERFFRVSGENEETFPGMGIGLYISAEIVKRHGGRIWVDSQKGKGSTFWFIIPKASVISVKE